MIVVVGLGAMGLALARRLHGLGYPVTGVDRDENRRDEWNREPGAEVPFFTSMESVRWEEVKSLVIFVMTPEQVYSVLRDVLSLSGGEDFPCYIMSTLTPTAAQGLEALTRETRHTIIECPVSGGEWGARKGELSIAYKASTVGADSLGEIEKFLGDLAKATFRTRQWGEPTLIKLFNNLVAATNAATLAGAIQAASKMGVDAGLLLEYARESSGSGWIADNFTRFPEPVLWKDVGLIKDVIDTVPIIDVNNREHFIEQISAARSHLPDHLEAR